MDDKILVIVVVMVLCVATLGVAMHSEVPSEIIALIEKALYGLFGLASGTGVGFALGKKSTDKKKEALP